jgi:hypothetical protein
MYKSVYVTPGCDLLLPRRSTMATITSPMIKAADWTTFTPVQIAHVIFELNTDTFTVRITNCSQDNLLLTSEMVVGHVITFQEDDYQYVLQQQDLDDCRSYAVAILDFYSSLELMTKFNYKSQLVNLKLGEHITIDMFPTVYDLVRIK